ncbi:hypothetical protein OQA88_10723 [Cercophora sp. LCS_1]
MAELNTQVHIGTWMNHSNNILTLTLKEREAAILSAALVIFVGIVASNAWTVTKFLLHQARARRGAGDALHKQQQVALRNSANNAHALTLLAQLAFFGTGRSRARSGAFGATILLLLVALVALLAWSAAQLFVTVLWTVPGGQSLIVSQHCGWAPKFANITRPDTLAWFTWAKDRMTVANTYQLQCYGGHNSSSSDASKCTDFPVSRIPWTTSDAGCPFADSDLCVSVNSTPIRMDSGYINSRTHLGVNVPTEDTVDYRYVAVCSPLVTDFNRTRNGETKYYYGVNDDFNEGKREGDSNETATFLYNKTEHVGVSQYEVYGYSYVVDKEFKNLKGEWRPNKTMIPDDKPALTMTIFFISSHDMWNVHKVDDPIFGTKESGRKIANVPAHVPVNPVSILGCTEEYELCNPALPAGAANRCLPLSRPMSNETLFDRLQLSPAQRATTLTVRVELEKGLFRYYVNMLNPQLLASTTMKRGEDLYFQYFPFPVDHWRREVSRWFDINLIMLQSAFVDFAKGISDPEVRKLAQTPEQVVEHDRAVRGALRDLCGQQIVRNVVGVRSFNLQVITGVVVAGVLIIAMGYGLPDAAGWFQQRWNRGDGRRRQWVEDDMLLPGPPQYLGLPRNEYGGYHGEYHASAEHMKSPLTSPYC